MKKLLLILAVYLFCIPGLWGQRVYVEKDYTEIGDIPGYINYQISYLTETDDFIPHGPVVMHCDYFNDDNYNGKLLYNLNCNHKNGALHGNFSLKYILDCAYYNEESYILYSTNQSLTGKFNNGVPDGTFNVNYCYELDDDYTDYQYLKGQLVGIPKYDKETITCTYKNGVLTGSFKWVYSYPDGESSITTGTFTSDGKMTGQWRNGDDTYSFINGVLVQSEDYDANLKKLANSYGSKKITLEQLEANHCVSSRSYSDLYPEISSTIQNENIVNWEILGDFSFDLEIIPYEELYYLPSLSEEGVSRLLSEINSMKYVTKEPESFFEKGDAACKYIRVNGDDGINEYRIGPAEGDDEYRIYLTDKQYNQIKDALNVKYEAYKVALMGSQFEAAARSNSLSEKSFDCPEDCLADYMPIVGFEYLDCTRTESDLIMHTKVNVANKSGVGYKTFNWDVYLNPTDYSINVEKTYDKTKRTQVPNEYDTINVVLDSLNTLSAPVLEAGKLAFPSSLQSYKAQLKKVTTINHKDLSGTIFAMRNFAKSIPSAEEWMKKSAQVKTNDKKIREAAASLPAILNPYSEFFGKYDFSWTPEVNSEKLRKLISIQEETLTLIANNNKILENTRQIKEEGQSFEDFIPSYLSTVSADVVWTKDVDVESTEKTLDMQRKTLEYLALRKGIIDNDPKLKEMSSAGKVLYKLYTTYRKTADLSWTPEVDMTSLDELYKIQEGCKEMLGYSDIKDICKSIKKAKIVDVKVAIEQFRK